MATSTVFPSDRSTHLPKHSTYQPHLPHLPMNESTQQPRKFNNGDLVQFALGGAYYAGQVEQATKTTVHMVCINHMASPEIAGKTHIRYADEVWYLRTVKDFLLLGIDSIENLPYPVNVSQAQLVSRVADLRDSTSFEALQQEKQDNQYFQNRQERRKQKMILKRSDIPVSVRGKIGTLSVSVRENGQIGFSTKSAELFKDVKLCMIDFTDERVMSFTPVAEGAKLPKGYTKEDLFEVAESKEGARYISLSGIFKAPTVNYNYKEAGTHTFDAKVEKGVLSFTLPVKMEMKAKTPRVKKVKAAADVAATPVAAGAAAGGNTIPPTAPTGDEPELVED